MLLHFESFVPCWRSCLSGSSRCAAKGIQKSKGREAPRRPPCLQVNECLAIHTARSGRQPSRSLPHHLSEIAVGRRHQPEIDVDGFGAAQSFRCLLLQSRQQLGLEIQRNVAHFIQKQSPAMRISKRPILCPKAPVKAQWAWRLAGVAGGVGATRSPGSRCARRRFPGCVAQVFPGCALDFGAQRKKPSERWKD